VAIWRGLALLVVAIVIGVLVLDRSQPASLSQASVRSSTTPTTSRPSSRSAARGRSRHANSRGAPSPTTTVPPAQVKTLVANGTQTTGLAARVGAKLQTDGYDVLSPVNATQQVTASAVYYISGSSAAATEVASALGLSSSSVHPLPSSSPPVSSAEGAQVVVVAGPDLATRFPASSTPTTASGTAPAAV
jgi:LytR cell envelope-related transcriptional attenuator